MNISSIRRSSTSEMMGSTRISKVNVVAAIKESTPTISRSSLAPTSGVPASITNRGTITCAAPTATPLIWMVILAAIS